MIYDSPIIATDGHLLLKRLTQPICFNNGSLYPWTKYPFTCPKIIWSEGHWSLLLIISERINSILRVDMESYLDEWLFSYFCKPQRKSIWWSNIWYKFQIIIFILWIKDETGSSFLLCSSLHVFFRFEYQNDTLIIYWEVRRKPRDVIMVITPKQDQ